MLSLEYQYEIPPRARNKPRAGCYLVEQIESGV